MKNVAYTLSRDQALALREAGVVFRPATLYQLTPGSGVYVGQRRIAYITNRPYFTDRPLSAADLRRILKP